MADKAEKMDKKTFDRTVALFKTATARSMLLAKVCAEAALQEFATSGNLNWCQDFYEAMPQNWTRRAAFLKWLTAFAPVDMVNKKFKQKAGGSWQTDIDLEKAFKKPFWEYAPEAEIVNFSAKDLVAEVIKLAERFANTKHKVAADDTANERLKELKKFADDLKAKTA